MIRLLPLALLLGACSTMSVRSDAPVWSATARHSLNDTSACVVKALNTAFHSDVPLIAPSITHQVQVIEPNRVFEVLPQQTITIGAELYIVRLTAESPNTTRVDLQSIVTWTSKVQPAVESCV
jgi:hypothetical protein